MSTSREVGLNRWVSASVLLVAFLLVGLSAPNLIAYSYLARVPLSVENALKSGDHLPEPVLALALAHYERAASYLPDNALIRQDLGRLQMRQLERKSLSGNEREEILSSASSNFVASIVAAPARSFAWALESNVRSERSSPAVVIAESMRMSYALGPHEASSMLLRVRLGSQYWADMPDDVRDNLKRDFVRLWSIVKLRRSLIDIYLASNFEVRSAIRSAVLSDAIAARHFDTLLAKVLTGTKRP